MFIRPAILILTIYTILLLLSCGYFENDKTEYQIEIVGNIKIHKQQSNEENNLVYEERKDFFSVIVANCKSVYYDSSNKIIFSESIVNKYNSNYYKISVTDSKSNDITSAIKKETIEKDLFFYITKQIKKKWEFDGNR